MYDTSKIIDSWDKWKLLFPEVDWDKFLEKCEANKGDYTAINPLIDELQDYGVKRGTAEVLVHGVFGLL